MDRLRTNRPTLDALRHMPVSDVIALPAEHLALHLANANSTHAVSYVTEAGLFQQAGIPAIICGPGSIEQAHRPDEYIDMSELRKCEVFMARLVTQLV